MYKNRPSTQKALFKLIKKNVYIKTNVVKIKTYIENAMRTEVTCKKFNFYYVIKLIIISVI